MWSTILTILFVYFLVRFVVGFVLPVSRTYRKVKRKMNEMNEFQPVNNTGKQEASKPSFSSKTTSKAEYIDFEEIK